MAYTTAAAVKTELANMVGAASSASLVSRYDGIVATSVEWGYQEIISALRERGYTQAQIDAWDRREEFNLSMALFWALSRGVVKQAEYNSIKQLDRRKELETVAILIDGDLADPGAGAGMVGYGSLTFDEDTARFTPDTEF